jgi:AbrB family looped-hinge helix DNA binding protein
MPAVFRMKVGKDGYSLKVTIPQEIAEALELAAGDAVLMEVTDHKLVVRKSPTSMSLA